MAAFCVGWVRSWLSSQKAPLLSHEASTNVLVSLALILELFTGASKAHMFQTARFLPGDAAHQSQGSFDQVSTAQQSGLPISQWWPNGSATRPMRQPCSSETAKTSVAPAAMAC